MPDTARKQVVVIGAGLGGLSAAIRARLLGHDVLVLEAASQAGGKAAAKTVQGYRFDPGPSIVILTRIYERLFADASRSMGDYLTFRRLEPLTRVCFGSDQPFDIPASRSKCLDTVRQVAGSDAGRFEELLDKLDRIAPQIERSVFAHPIDRIWQLADPDLARAALQFTPGATYRELIDRWFQSPILKAFFYGFPSYSGQTYRTKSFAPLLIPYYMIQEGAFYPEGGVSAIPLAFERLARELGVEFRFGTKVEGFELKGDRIGAVKTATHERIAAEAVISNVDRLTTRELLGVRERFRPSFSYFTCQWGLRRQIGGLAHHTLVVPSDFEMGFEDLYEHRRFPGSPIVYLNATSITDSAVAPAGSTNLFAVVSAPAIERGTNWAADTPQCRAKILQTLQGAGIAWEEQDVEVELIQTPSTFEERDGNFRGSLYGPDEPDRLFGGLMPLRNWDERIRNLFYCGGSVQPGAGLPMVTLSGQFAVDAMQRRLG